MASSKSVTACVLIIGNEILSGRTQDINLNYISKTLGKWGIQVREARVIPDVEETIIETLNSVRKHTTMSSPQEASVLLMMTSPLYALPRPSISPL